MMTQGTMFNKGSMPALAHALSFTEQRHRVLAHNVANVETPGFVARDLPEQEFRQLLQRSFEARDSRKVRRFEMHEGRDIFNDAGRLVALPSASAEGIMRHGENTVDIDSELSKLARNAVEYRTYTALLHKHFQLMRDTISGRA